MMSNVILKDESGFPYLVDEQILLGVKDDRRPRPVGTGLTRGSASGNPFFDPRTGKFGFAPPTTSIRAGGAVLRTLSAAGRKEVAQRAASVKADAVAAFATEKGVKVTLLRNGRPVDDVLLPRERLRSANLPTVQGSPEELRRRMDAVRDAAREFDRFGEGDVKEFLKGRTLRDLSPAEIEMFVADVTEQRLSDLVDILDQRLRKKGLGRFKRDRRTVQINVPKGFARKSLHGLLDEEVSDLAIRLRAKGWSDDDLVRELIGRFHERRRPRLAALLGVDAD